MKKPLLPCLKDNYSTFMGWTGCCAPGIGIFIYSTLNIALNILFTVGNYWGISGIVVYSIYAIATIPIKSFPPPDSSAIMLRIGNILYLIVLVLDTAWLVDYAIWYAEWCRFGQCDPWTNWNMAAAVIRLSMDYFLGYFIMSSAESAARGLTGFF